MLSALRSSRTVVGGIPRDATGRHGIGTSALPGPDPPAKPRHLHASLPARTARAVLFALAITSPLIAQQIIGVTPNTGHYRGYEVVEVRGSSFLPPCGVATCFPEGVYFGVEQVEVLSWTDTAITVRTPSHRIGAVDVTVAARNGNAVVAPSAFSFITGEAAEQVLLPLLMTERPGAFGSRWRTHLVIRNGSPSAISLDPYDLTVPAGGTVRDPAQLTPPATDAIPARMLWVPRDREDVIVMELRARDMSRQSETWGVDIPVVRERDFRVRTISLVDIPTDQAFRVSLRIYGLDRFEGIGARHDFLIRVYELESNRLLAERRVVAEVSEPIVTPPRSPTRPAMFQMFDVVAAMPEVEGVERLRIDIAPFSWLPVVPGQVSLFWAFATVTHNSTQSVTLVMPD